MPAWIHERADHIRKHDPGMPKSEAFAIATQQAYAAGKAPSKFGTSKGRSQAKKKYSGGKKEYKQVADPSHKSKTAANLALWKGFSTELEKIALSSKPTSLTDMKQIVGAFKKETLLGKPKLTAKPQGVLPAANEISDPLSSAKTVSPPPITLGQSF